MDEVVLVDTEDREIGRMEKLLAHQKGLLHRAFSVFLFNSKGEMLIQRRALDKYHSAGLWSNTCCSHPKPDESIEDAANRRLQEEMGMQAVLEKNGHIVYRAEFENGLVEHELDHVFVGSSDQVPMPDPSEVFQYRYVSPDELREEVESKPEIFSYWFRLLYEDVLQKVKGAA
jgi:isopentenyl-diphosphate delta-isomerase